MLFNKFLKENELKRRRAEFRANEEKKKRKKLEAEIAAKRQELDQKNRELVLKSRRLRKNEKYKTFLQQTHDKNDTDFEEDVAGAGEFGGPEGRVPTQGGTHLTQLTHVCIYRQCFSSIFSLLPD